MDKIILLFLLFTLLGCTEESPKSIVSDDKPNQEIKVPIAKHDFFSITENTTLQISSLLKNDVEVANSMITSINKTTNTKGNIVENRDGSFTYTPLTNFTGTDIFTYTVCNKTDKEKCDTANINIEVKDAGSPTVTNDEVSVAQNSTKILETLTQNDYLVDNAKIISVTQNKGNVVLNTDGTISYTALSDYVGVDTFTYTVCDNDTPTSTCVTATVTVNVVEQLAFNIPNTIKDYYSTVVFSAIPNDLLTELKKITIAKHTNKLTYFDRHDYLYTIDEDPNNLNNVILMYTSESRDKREYTSGTNSHQPQTFNTEHVYPQSLYKGGDVERADLHHLRVCDASINSQRSNYPFTTGSGIAKRVGNAWYPGDEWKGDVARMIFYLHARYDDAFSKVGNIDLFLKWNKEDPVSGFEESRNREISKVQGNRNPFIDNPYLATIIWGQQAAENRWAD